jgi:nucleoid-associated protein YgaU
MVKYQRVTIVLLVALWIVTVASSVGAQNLLKENKYYQEAQELKRQAQQAFEEGDYDKAIQLSNRAKELTAEAESFAQWQVRIYKARGWMNRAEDFINWALGVGAKKQFPDKWEKASQSFTQARTLFDEEKWESSIEASRNTIAIIKTIEPRAETKPRYYIVRLIPERRDCFWRIAEYEFVYGNARLWPHLYKANKEKLPQPDNPDLILPGMKLRIPSISGERRSGTWNPENSQ